MNREQMLLKVDEAFEQYADTVISLEELRSYIRYIFVVFCEDLLADVNRITEGLDAAITTRPHNG